MNKYEQLIEHIINDNEQAARELFHSIVVEKSREIYESLMDEDQVDENIDQYDQQGNMVDDISSNVHNDENGGLGEDDEEMEIPTDDEGMGDMDDMGGDEFGGMGGDDMGGEEGGIEGKFQSIEDAIEELKAEFAELTGDAGAGEDEFGGPEGEGDNQSGTGSDEGDMGGEEAFNEAAGSGMSGSGASGSGSGVMEGEQPEWLKKKGSGAASGSGKSGSGKSGAASGSGKSGSGKAMSEAEMMREYVEKISAPANTEGTAVGTGNKTPKVSVNTKNPLAGKNDMGGSAKNIANGKSDAGDVDGNSTKAKAGGFVQNPQEIDVAKRNVNKVGGNKGAQDFYNTKAKGKTGEGQTTDGSVSVNKSSLEGGKK